MPCLFTKTIGKSHCVPPHTWLSHVAQTVRTCACNKLHKLVRESIKTGGIGLSMFNRPLRFISTK